jgi:hypothetical protein
LADLASFVAMATRNPIRMEHFRRSILKPGKRLKYMKEFIVGFIHF